ncbi:MAG: (d)CMP kinase [Devosiaceae bacterium]|nr:(d)CMP kinase [Devosiaceae bacterium]
MIITIDGPAASGKGTIAKALAKYFGLPFLDTGLLYRAVGKNLLDHLNDPDLEDLAHNEAMKIDPSRLDEKILGHHDIAMAASKVAQFPKVREALFKVQRDFATQTAGAVLDGRDTGTKICPEADVKIFVKAMPEIRAKRRTAQLLGLGENVSEEKILSQIIIRDENDRKNPAGAFFPAKDAHLLDTSELDIEGALKAAIAIVEEATPMGLD